MSDWPAALRSGPVSLRRATTIAEAPPWLAEAERAVRGSGAGDGAGCPLAARLESGDAVYWITAEHAGARAVAGAAAARIERGALVWTWLAVGEAWRAFGYGGVAVSLVERGARRGGARRARARVPASNGVALYFWLRLGYRPVRAGQVADAQTGHDLAGTWMVRETI